jgi:hypothetical protein
LWREEVNCKIDKRSKLMKTLDEIKKTIKKHKAELEEKYKVSE